MTRQLFRAFAIVGFSLNTMAILLNTFFCKHTIWLVQLKMLPTNKSHTWVRPVEKIFDKFPEIVWDAKF